MRAVIGLSSLLLVAGLVSAPGVSAAPSATAEPAAAAHEQAVAKRTSVKALLKKLPRKRQTPAGYQRSKFRHWVDANANCRDTRAEVLVAESTTATGGGCRITTGRWRSAYDGQVLTNASGLDIDHMVPLAEAWRSGAKKWSKGTRKRFANDLGYGPSLIAVSASTNRSKGDREPHRWMPPNTSFRCAYVASWVAVKWRWRLAANKAERKYLKRTSTACGNPKFTKPSRAKVKAGGGGGSGKGGSSGGGGTGTGGGGGSKGTDPQFNYCYEAIEAGYGPYYRGTDPEYDWYRDADGDGVVCE